jgi:hypothetical protein
MDTEEAIVTEEAMATEEAIVTEEAMDSEDSEVEPIIIAITTHIVILAIDTTTVQAGRTTTRFSDRDRIKTEAYRLHRLTTIL